MKVSKLMFSGLFISLLSTTNAQSMQQLEPVLQSQQISSPITSLLSGHVNRLNELSSRRRVNTFFNNEQSIFDGLQKGYVNVSRGNLTFTRRDLVTVGRMPIVLSRIYDSGFVGGEDFGLGWHLSLAQSIEQAQDGTLFYRDESATLNEFIPTTVGYKINPAQNSDIKSVVFNSLGQLQITYLNNWVKQFDKLGDKYLLVSVADNNHNKLELHYDNNRLHKVTGSNNRFVTLRRNDSGKIVGIEDDAGRVVSYHYDPKNSLTSVDDLASNRWHYSYLGNNLLNKVIDPSGRVAGHFTYTKDNRVSSTKIRAQKHNFKYQDKQTKVKDQNSNTTTFTHNAAGITTAITDANGFTSRIVLNKRHQITQLWHNNSLQTTIIYDESGRPYRYDINGKPTQVENNQQHFTYQYDKSGRTISIEKSNLSKTRYRYDINGNLLQHSTDTFERSYQYGANGDVISETEERPNTPPKTTNYSYNADGLLSSIIDNGKTSKFDYNPIGKLATVIFPDGIEHQYRYDPLGFRTNTQRSDKSSVAYVYDAVGNLNELITHTGSTIIANKSQKQTSNGDNLLIEINNKADEPKRIKYSAKGNPLSITQGDSHAQYQYDKLGRLTAVIDSKQGQTNYQYKDDEEDIRLQLDRRTKGVKIQQTQVTDHNQTQAQLHYARASGTPWQAVIWNESLSKFLTPSWEQISAPDAGYQSSKQRRRLYDAKSTTKQHQLNFDKASNSFYRPAEYMVSGCGNEDPDYCLMFGVLIDNVWAEVDREVSLTALALGALDCSPYYTFVIDGQSLGYNSSGLQKYTFKTGGDHSLQVIAQCHCGGYAKWDLQTINVQCPIVEGERHCGPKPINFQQTGKGKLTDGTLTFRYDWESSNGNMYDIRHCEVSEEVKYLGSGPYYLPEPWDHVIDPNPTIDPVFANNYLTDENKPPYVSEPYKEAEFTALQRFMWRCPYYNNNDWQYFILPAPYPIGYEVTRKIRKNTNGSYRYEITKAGEENKVDPLP